ncbi:MAG TPA: methyltransferase [Acidocella sp.]|nr:methyltransferase [Acidocella sp.]
MKFALLAVIMCSFAAAISSPALGATGTADDPALAAVITGPQRTPAFEARDKYRHPLQTLEFFGIRPDMTVVEVLPGTGWFTEILAPYLKDHGQLIEATEPLSSADPYARKMATMFQKKLSSDPQVYKNVLVTPFDPPNYMPLGAPDSVDMVLTFDNLHDLVYLNTHREVSDLEMQAFLRSAYQTLKPGGVLGIVEHRAKPGSDVSDTIAAGRIPEAYMILQAKKAGFQLAATSEINANPKDDSTYPVWFLPPTLEQGEKDRTKYLAIGESDAMTLRFVKPNL